MKNLMKLAIEHRADVNLLGTISYLNEKDTEVSYTGSFLDNIPLDDYRKQLYFMSDIISEYFFQKAVDNLSLSTFFVYLGIDEKEFKRDFPSKYNLLYKASNEPLKKNHFDETCIKVKRRKKNENTTNVIN